MRVSSQKRWLAAIVLACVVLSPLEAQASYPRSKDAQVVRTGSSPGGSEASESVEPPNPEEAPLDLDEAKETMTQFRSESASIDVSIVEIEKKFPQEKLSEFKEKFGDAHRALTKMTRLADEWLKKFDSVAGSKELQASLKEDLDTWPGLLSEAQELLDNATEVQESSVAN